PPLLPGQHRGVRAEPGEDRADRVTVADHDPVRTAHLARFRLNTKASGRTDERERRLRPRAGDLQRGRAPRLGERAVREEGAAPGCATHRRTAAARTPPRAGSTSWSPSVCSARP